MVGAGDRASLVAPALVAAGHHGPATRLGTRRAQGSRHPARPRLCRCAVQPPARGPERRLSSQPRQPARPQPEAGGVAGSRGWPATAAHLAWPTSHSWHSPRPPAGRAPGPGRRGMGLAAVGWRPAYPSTGATAGHGLAPVPVAQAAGLPAGPSGTRGRRRDTQPRTPQPHLPGPATWPPPWACPWGEAGGWPGEVGLWGSLCVGVGRGRGQAHRPGRTQQAVACWGTGRRWPAALAAGPGQPASTACTSPQASGLWLATGRTGGLPPR